VRVDYYEGEEKSLKMKEDRERKCSLDERKIENNEDQGPLEFKDRRKGGKKRTNNGKKEKML